jgi:hypothetical protein
VIEEIVVRVEDEALCLVIRCAGGDHTPLRVRKNRAGQHRWTTGDDVVELATVLARQMPDMTILPGLGVGTVKRNPSPYRGMVSRFRRRANAWFPLSFGAFSQTDSDGFSGFALSGPERFQIRVSSVSVVSVS